MGTRRTWNGEARTTQKSPRPRRRALPGALSARIYSKPAPRCPLSLRPRRQFGCPGPFWARSYLFWHDGQPLTLIYEAFSPRLHAFLGPSCPID